MSDHPKVQDTIKRQIKCLDEQIKYEEWRAEMMNYVLSKYPVAYSHIEHKVDPATVFQTPILDYTIRIARKPATNIVGYIFENPADATLPIWRPTDADFNTHRFDTYDDEFYYIFERNVQFLGTAGQKMWEMQCSSIIRLQSKHLYETKPQLWADLEHHIADTILAKVRIPLDTYNAKKLLLDYMWLFEKIKMVHTGEGSASLCLKISEIINLRHQDLTIDTYNTTMLNAREDLLKMNVNPGNFIANFISVIYHIGLLNFASNNPTIELKLQEIFQMNGNWPTMDSTMNSIITAITIRNRIQTDNTFGVIRANQAMSSVSPMPQIEAYLSKQSPSNHSKTPYYKSLSVGGRDGNNKVMQCFNCGGNHRAANCTEAPAVCKTCHKTGHCTSMHNQFIKVKEIVRSRTKPISNNNSLKSKFQAMEANIEQNSFEVDEEAQEEDFKQLVQLEAFMATNNATGTINEEQKWQDCDEDYSEGMSDELPVSYSKPGNFTAYSTKVCVIDSFTGEELPLLNEFQDISLMCHHGYLENDDGLIISPIVSKLDSATNGNLIMECFVSHTSFYDVKPINNVSVLGINGNSKTAVPVKYIGKHPVIGTVYFGPFASNLVGLRILYKRGYRSEGQETWHNIINMKTNKVAYRFLANGEDMFVADIAVYPTSNPELFEQAEQYHKSKRALKPSEHISANVATSDVLASNSEQSSYQYPTSEPLIALNGEKVHLVPIGANIKVEMPLTALEITRAKEAKRVHDALHHPCNRVLKETFRHGILLDTNLSPRDVDNMERYFGKCAACQIAKITDRESHSNDEIQATLPGEALYMDLKAVQTRGYGGVWQLLFAMCFVTGYAMVCGMTDKRAVTIVKHIKDIVSFFLSHGHKVKIIIFDHEQTFIAVKELLINTGIQCKYIPAGKHNKVIERCIQDLEMKKNASEANLPYKLFDNLDEYAYISATMSHNSLSSTNVPHSSPAQLVTGMRPPIPLFAYGEVVIAIARIDNIPHGAPRGQPAVFLYQECKGAYVVYLPDIRAIVSRRKCESTNLVPDAWKLLPRPTFTLTDYRQELLNEDAEPQLADRTIANPTTTVGTTNPTTDFPSITQFIPRNFQLANQTTNVNVQGSTAATVLPVSTANQPINQSEARQTLSLTPTFKAADTPNLSTPVRSVPALDPSKRLTSEPVNTTPVKAATIPFNSSPVKTATIPSDSSPVKAAPILRRSNRIVKPADRLSYDSPGQQSNDRHKKAYPTSINLFKYKIGKGGKGIPTPNWSPKYKRIDPYQMKHRITCYRISLRLALRDANKERAESAKRAMREEVQQLIDMDTLEPHLLSQIPESEHKFIIPSHLFFKEKYRADGEFDRWKGRLVCGGNFVDTSLSGDISAHVVNPITVMMMLSMAAIKQNRIITCDVKGAFLIPELGDSPGDRTYIVIDKLISDVIVEIKPEWASRRNSNGTFIMKLRKALYGLPISANRWMTHLNNTLTSLGFEPVPGDRCCFTRGLGEFMIILCSHVDDLLVLGKQAQLDIFCDEIRKKYDINIQVGLKHSYIGLDIIQCNSTYRVSVGQSGYRKDVINRFADLISSDKRQDGRTPSNPDITEEIPSEYLDSVGKTLYMSIIMSVMYLSRFTRPDLSFTVSILTTHCSKPTRAHMRQAIKLLKYIASSPDYAIVFNCGNCNPTIYADASHAIHMDGKGHGCLLMMIGTGMVYIRSYKLRLVTLSSTESEWTVLCDATTLAEWTKSMLLSFGRKVDFILVKQDNTSAIWLATNHGNFARTKHLLVKRNKAKEGILLNIIRIKYCSTDIMKADLGTKVLVLRMILSHMKYSGMMMITRPSGIYTLRPIEVPKVKRVYNSAK